MTRKTSPNPQHPRRRHVLPAMMRRHHFKDSLQVAQPNGMSNSALAGIQAALAVGIALPIVYLSAWSGLIGFAGLGALAALFGRFAPHGQRTKIVLFAGLTQVAAVSLMSLAAFAGLPTVALIVLLGLMSGGVHYICVKGRFGPPGALIFIFAATAAMRAPADVTELVSRSAMTGAVALLAVLLCALTEPLRFKGDEARPLPKDEAKSEREIWVVCGRIALASLIAGLVAMALGMAHGGWAAMGAIAVLVGARLHFSLHRAVQRTAGTIVGSVLVLGVLALNPNIWVVIALIVLLQILTEMVIGYNYAFGQIFVTPMALLMTYIAANNIGGFELASERIIDTLIGVAVALIVAVVTSNLQDRQEFIEKHKRR